MSSDSGHGASHGAGRASPHSTGHAVHSDSPGDSGSTGDVVIFAAVLAFVAVVLTLLLTKSISPVLLVVLLLAVVLAAFLMPRVVQLKEYERAVILRFGKFLRVQDPGLAIYFPRFEQIIVVDMRIRPIDTKQQDVETLDRIRIKIDAICYIKVTDPRKVALEVKDLEGSLQHLLTAEIRDVVSRMPLDAVVNNTEAIGNEVASHFKEAEARFGTAVVDVEIESVELPKSLSEAITKKREATEQKERQKTEAESRKVSLEILDEATSKMSERTLAYLYLDTLKQMAQGRSSKIILPLEITKLASMLSTKLGVGAAKEESNEGLMKMITAYISQQKISSQKEETAEEKDDANEENEDADEEEEGASKPWKKPSKSRKGKPLFSSKKRK